MGELKEACEAPSNHSCTYEVPRPVLTPTESWSCETSAVPFTGYVIFKQKVPDRPRNRNVSGIPNLLVNSWKMCVLAQLLVRNGIYVGTILKEEESIFLALISRRLAAQRARTEKHAIFVST